MEKTDLLVIAPHEDDELAIAGAMLYGAVKKNMRIKVVFATNGDYYAHEGAIRIREAKEALAVLGVKKEDILFLGYGDQTRTKHLYNSRPEEVVPSYNGRTETYGTAETPEFAWTEYGVHHTYTRTNYKNDIKAVIKKYMPSILITTDWDNHMDHLALSLMTDEIMGELLREEQDYHPLLLKAQAYNGKWEGNSDYYMDQNLTEFVNQADGTLHEHPMNQWKDRIRFSVPKECRTNLLRKNVLYQAARRYRSQSVDLKAPQFINLDMVYWRRPTDSFTYRAEIETSSGEGKYLNDFKCLDCSDIINGMWNYDNSVWIPDIQDTEKMVTITLEKPEKVREIHLFENPAKECMVHDMKLLFDNGRELHTGELNHDGSRTIIKVPDMEPVKQIILKIEQFTGNQAGLTEIEVYEYIHPLTDETLPLPLWKNEPEELQRTGTSFGRKAEQKWLRFVTYGRVRLWPDKYFLMKRDPKLTETDSAFAFWKAYFRFAAGKIREKI